MTITMACEEESYVSNEVEWSFMNFMMIGGGQ